MAGGRSMHSAPVVEPAKAGGEAEKTEHAGKAPWGPWSAVLYAVFVYLAALTVASLLVSVYPLVRGWGRTATSDWLSDSVIAQFWYVAFAEALTFGATWQFIRWRKSGLRMIGWRRLRARDPVFTLAGFGVYFFGYAILLALVTHIFPGINVNQKQQLGFQNVSGGLDMTLAFLSLVVFPPLVEETVFRGFVFTGLRTRLKWWWAALLTSLLFASAHLGFGGGQPLLWAAALDTFTLSLVLCYLRQKTDSLWPGILLHALKNTVAFASLFIFHLS